MRHKLLDTRIKLMITMTKRMASTPKVKSYKRAGRIAECHGLSKTPEYRVWAAMISRCRNPNDQSFNHYGARGIKVCSRWRESFVLFLADVGVRPSKSHSLDRENNDGNYDPKNARWVLRRVQAQNTRRNKKIEYKGEALAIAEVARRIGLSRHTVRTRLNKGMTAKEAAETPRFGGLHVNWAPRALELVASGMPAPDIARKLGLEYRKVWKMLHRRGIKAAPSPNNTRTKSRRARKS